MQAFTEGAYGDGRVGGWCREIAIKFTEFSNKEVVGGRHYLTLTEGKTKKKVPKD